MKRTVLFLALLLLTLQVFADATSAWEGAKTLYSQGRYENAKQAFTACRKTYAKEIGIIAIDEWITKCDRAIEQKKAQERAAKQYQQEQKAREANKLVCVQAVALADEVRYEGMANAIMGQLVDEGFYFTDKPQKAYWTVNVTAIADKWTYTDENDDAEYAVVVAQVQVVDNIADKIILATELRYRLGGVDYADAVYNTYEAIVNEKIAPRIVAKLQGRKYIPSKKEIDGINVIATGMDGKLPIQQADITAMESAFRQCLRGNGYRVLASRTEAQDKALKHNRSGAVNYDETLKFGKEMGVSLLCEVSAGQKSDGTYLFTATISEIESKMEVNSSVYPAVVKDRYSQYERNITDLSRSEEMSLATMILLRRLGFLDDTYDVIIQEQVKKVDQIREKERAQKVEEYNDATRLRSRKIASAFVPGMAQIDAGAKGAGAGFICGEVLAVGGLVAAESLKSYYEDYMRKHEREPDLKKWAYDRANYCDIAGYVGIAAVVGIYVGNVIDGAIRMDKKYPKPAKVAQVRLAPYATMESVGIAMNITF